MIFNIICVSPGSSIWTPPPLTSELLTHTVHRKTIGDLEQKNGKCNFIAFEWQFDNFPSIFRSIENRSLLSEILLKHEKIAKLTEMSLHTKIL